MPDAEGLEVKCPYCGSSVPLPEEMRRERQDAKMQATLKSLKPWAKAFFAVILLSILAPACVGAAGTLLAIFMGIAGPLIAIVIGVLSGH